MDEIIRERASEMIVEHRGNVRAAWLEAMDLRNDARKGSKQYRFFGAVMCHLESEYRTEFNI